jgi:polar amino acid transport system substrate-binding protein
MNRLIAAFVTCILGIGGLAGGWFWPTAAAAESQVLLAATEYPPYYGEHLPKQGVITEIIVEAFKISGYKVVIDFLPWKRALEATKRGEYDALFSAWYRQDRTQWFDYSDPLPIANQLVFFKRIDRNISYRTFEDLRPYKIGVVRGYSNPVEFDRAGLNTEAVTDDHLNMKKLAAGRVDLVLIDKIIGQYIIKTELPESAPLLEWLDPPVTMDNQYLIFSKRVKGFAAKRAAFNQGLSKLIESGRVEEIIARQDFR